MHAQAATVTGYGGPAGDVTACTRITEGVQDIGVDASDRILVLVDGTIHPGDSGGPLLIESEGGPILIGILGEITSWGETNFGSAVWYERLRDDDPWVLDHLSSTAVGLP
jgi:hypothetical protein